MASILVDKEIKQAIKQIAIRTEREEPEDVVDTFYDCNIISHLSNNNHQIIQGRRGTGKTHILLVLKDKIEDDRHHSIYFDCKNSGSAAQISDTEVPDTYRAIQLIRDFLLYLHGDFLKYFNFCMQQGNIESANEIQELINMLHSECYSYGFHIEKYEQNEAQKESTEKAWTDSFSLSALKEMSASWGLTGQRQHGKESRAEYNTAGIPYNKVVFPNIFECLEGLAKLTNKKYYILIDEWSNLPTDIQPHFAEFLRRCIMPSKFFTVKIAVVGSRTKYCIKKELVAYGFEVGADISVAIDLDNLYLFDNNPRKVVSDLYRILWKHLKAKGVLPRKKVDEFICELFEDFKSAVLLARASEGNPRDFISILNNCIIGMDGIGNSGTWISQQIVRIAANEWYDKDKAGALSNLQKNLLDEISAYVAYGKNNRGFVIDESYLQHPAFKGLIDARVLHVVQINRHFPLLGSNPKAILVLDFGTYSNLLLDNNESGGVTFLTNDAFENAIFSRTSLSNYDDTFYPFDRDRKFRMCYLDPQLSPDICPSFFEFERSLDNGNM